MLELDQKFEVGKDWTSALFLLFFRFIYLIIQCSLLLLQIEDCAS